MLHRRSFLTGFGLLIAAPAIVRAESLMQIRAPSLIMPSARLLRVIGFTSAPIRAVAIPNSIPDTAGVWVQRSELKYIAHEGFQIGDLIAIE